MASAAEESSGRDLAAGDVAVGGETAGWATAGPGSLLWRWAGDTRIAFLAGPIGLLQWSRGDQLRLKALEAGVRRSWRLRPSALRWQPRAREGIARARATGRSAGRAA